MYKLLKIDNKVVSNIVFRVDDSVYIPFDPANTDYQNFKKQINADEAQLEDADGNLMTDAKAFVATLP
jgi:hypothetical protein